MTTLTRWLMLEERSASCDEKTKMIYIIRIAGIKDKGFKKVLRCKADPPSGTPWCSCLTRMDEIYRLSQILPLLFFLDKKVSSSYNIVLRELHG